MAISAVGAVAAGAKDEVCLSSPKGAAPTGQRWFYRVEHPSNRHCWYTRAESGRVAAASKAPLPQRPKDPVMAEVAKEPTTPPLLPNIANARAEASASLAPPIDDTPRAAPIKVAENVAPSLADRWPDPIEQTAAPAVRLMKVVPAHDLEKVVASPPSEEIEPSSEGSFLERLVDVGSFVLALAGLATLVTAVIIRRRKRTLESEADFEPVEDANGGIVRTWYEPPLDRLRMARHLADLPQPAFRD